MWGWILMILNLNDEKEQFKEQKALEEVTLVDKATPALAKLKKK